MGDITKLRKCPLVSSSQQHCPPIPVFCLNNICMPSVLYRESVGVVGYWVPRAGLPRPCWANTASKRLLLMSIRLGAPSSCEQVVGAIQFVYMSAFNPGDGRINQHFGGCKSCASCQINLRVVGCNTMRAIENYGSGIRKIHGSIIIKE